MNARLIYISGPMTGLPELNFPAFHSAARVLRKRGHAVVNPAELNTAPDTAWAECMRVDIKALLGCDGIVLLPGYGRSKGASLELLIAQALDMQIARFEDLVGLRA